MFPVVDFDRGVRRCGFMSLCWDLDRMRSSPSKAKPALMSLSILAMVAIGFIVGGGRCPRYAATPCVLKSLKVFVQSDCFLSWA